MSEVHIRPLDELDIGAIVAINEKISGKYRPDEWEGRVGYYVRRDPEAQVVAELDGEVVGFMLAEVRSGEFGLEEAAGWIEVLGVDPECRGRAVGRKMAESLLATFRDRGVSKVHTLIDDDMEEIALFFSSLGFEPGSLRPFVLSL